jgi:putative ABC transport system permease protein
LVLLAAVMPLFAATAFRPSWWQILLAALVGSALGQVALRATRDRRVARWSVAAAAAIVVVGAVGWAVARDARHDDSAGTGFLVVGSRDRVRPSLTWDDVREIETRIPSVRFAVPQLRKAMQLLVAEQNWNTSVVGTTPDYFDLMALHVAAGDRFDAATAKSGSKVVVLGDTVVAQLFGKGETPVGEVVQIRNMPFTIIGVLAHRGESPQGQDLDDIALVPIDVYTTRIAAEPKSRFGGTVLVSATSRDETARVEAELRSLLRDRHLLGPADNDDFIIRNVNPE